MQKLNGRFTEAQLNEKDREGEYVIPRITIAGETWSIPRLAPRQNRRIIPRMSRIGMVDFSKLTEEDIDDLYMIVFWALTRAYDIQEIEFMDMEIPMPDLMPAIAVITEQTGMAKLRAPGDEPEGEAPAQTSTGTGSSPEPAPQQDGPGTTLKTSTSLN